MRFPNGVYIAKDLHLSSKVQLRSWMRNSLPRELTPNTDDLHCTLIYSKKGLDKQIDTDPRMMQGTFKNFALFGKDKDTLVIELDSPELKTRNKSLVNKYGFVSDHGEYKPHITVAYDVPSGFDINKLGIPMDTIYLLTGENVEHLDDGWKANTDDQKIEESSTMKIVDSIQVPEYQYSKINESSNGLSGVIGVMKGPHFFPNGHSRNKRFYCNELWENVCSNPKIQERQNDNLVLGTCGHDVDMNEKAIREGLVSHYTKNMNIVHNGNKLVGVAETYIMDTPVGRVLDVLMRSGVKLSVSSRADGRLLNKQHEGSPMVDPKSFMFERFDIVIDPGFLEAKPNFKAMSESLSDEDIQLFESFISEKKDNKDKAEKDSAVDGNAVIPGKYDDSVDVSDLQEYKNSNLNKGDKPMDFKKMYEEQVEVSRTLLAEKKQLNEDVTVLNKQLREQTSELNESLTLNDANHSKLKMYEELTTVDEVKAYQDLGTPEIIKEAMESSLEKVRETNNFFDEVGSFDEVAEYVEVSEATIAEYAELGESAESIKESLQGALAFVESAKEEHIIHVTEKLMNKYVISEDKISEMVSKGMNIDELDSFLEGMVEKKADKKNEMDDEKEDDEDMDEHRSVNSHLAGDTDALYESYTKPVVPSRGQAPLKFNLLSRINK